MSGDVFGNGLLLSRHMKLLAAFNHRHIFLDPNPDPAKSYEERQRLFRLPRSSWSDYDAKLISEGGGVFTRLAKSIAISPQVRDALGIAEDKLVPTDLINRILKAPVDLLWNGGIGTFVKASTESHEDVDDRANDAVRVDGRDLRVKVVAEGGNLGFTQRARVEYAMAGGRINTDFIDNSAGVDTSDHEVNIKILLNAQVQAGELTVKHRDRLLEEMTGDVAALVLRHNYQQALAVSIAEDHARESIDAHARMIRALEREGRLDRALEALPTDEELITRKAAARGLMRPEIAVLLAYAKIDLKTDLLETDAPDDPYFVVDLESYFPPAVRERFRDAIHGHRLRRQIVATSIINSLVNRTGPSFAYRIQEDTGAPTADIVRAYLTSREVYRLRAYWQAVEELDGKVPAAVQAGLFYEAEKVLERAARWFIRRPARARDMAASDRGARAGRRAGERAPRRSARAARSRARRRGGADARESRRSGGGGRARRPARVPVPRARRGRRGARAGRRGDVRRGLVPGGGRRAGPALAARRDRQDPHRRVLAPARRRQRVRRDLSRFNAPSPPRRCREPSARMPRRSWRTGWRRGPTRWRGCGRS